MCKRASLVAASRLTLFSFSLSFFHSWHLIPWVFLSMCQLYNSLSSKHILSLLLCYFIELSLAEHDNMSVVNTAERLIRWTQPYISPYLRPTIRFLSLSCVLCLQQLGRGLVETSHVRSWVSPGWVSVGHICHPPSFSYAHTLFQQWLQVTFSDRLVYPLRPVHPSVSLSLLRSRGRQLSARWWSAHKLQLLSLEAHSLLSTGHSGPWALLFLRGHKVRSDQDGHRQKSYNTSAHLY